MRLSACNSVGRTGRDVGQVFASGWQPTTLCPAALRNVHAIIAGRFRGRVALIMNVQHGILASGHHQRSYFPRYASHKGRAGSAQEIEWLRSQAGTWTVIAEGGNDIQSGGASRWNVPKRPVLLGDTIRTIVTVALVRPFHDWTLSCNRTIIAVSAGGQMVRSGGTAVATMLNGRLLLTARSLIVD